MQLNNATQTDLFDSDFPPGYHHVTAAKWKEFFGARTPDDVTLTELKLWHVNHEDHEWRRKYFANLPDFLAGFFAYRYENILKDKGRRDANTYLRKTMGENILPRLELVHSKYKPEEILTHWELPKELEKLPSLNRDQITEVAWKLSATAIETFNHYTDSQNYEPTEDEQEIYERTKNAYLHMCLFVKKVGINPPYYLAFEHSRKPLELRKFEAGILRMLDHEWLRKQLQRKRDLYREHLAIAVGQVQKAASPYCSKSTLQEWKEQNKRNLDFFKAHEIEDENGNRMGLHEMVLKSNANPAIRRCELMIRTRGFEDLAQEIGAVGEFYTMTAPSKYHSVHSKGGFVKNWNGNNPRETQKYLCSVWAKIRAALKRESINIFGFRVVEPHHDGTPHWHLLLFVMPEQLEQLRSIFERYACEEDAEELTSPQAKKARFHYEPIDPEKGSATGYIAKYISKNIDGYALDDQKDDETGENLKETAKNVTAWASRWRIRQFQQIGGAPVTVWRECRRLKDKKVDDALIDKVLACADVGDWAAYTDAQGGPTVSRADLVVRLAYNIEPEASQYAEDIQRIDGIYSPKKGLESKILTRETKWKIVRREKTNKEQPSESEAVLGLGLKIGREAAAWSSVNNCTRENSGGLDDQAFFDEREHIRYLLKHRGESDHEHNITVLQRGSCLDTGFGTVYKYRNGQIFEYENWES